jgi:hypothetical protein
LACEGILTPPDSSFGFQIHQRHVRNDPDGGAHQAAGSGYLSETNTTIASRLTTGVCASPEGVARSCHRRLASPVLQAQIDQAAQVRQLFGRPVRSSRAARQTAKPLPRWVQTLASSTSRAGWNPRTVGCQEAPGSPAQPIYSCALI